jgi:hypothetical protein
VIAGLKKFGLAIRRFALNRSTSQVCTRAQHSARSVHSVHSVRTQCDDFVGTQTSNVRYAGDWALRTDAQPTADGSFEREISRTIRCPLFSPNFQFQGKRDSLQFVAKFQIEKTRNQEIRRIAFNDHVQSKIYDIDDARLHGGDDLISLEFSADVRSEEPISPVKYNIGNLSI